MTSAYRTRRVILAAVIVGVGFFVSKVTGILDDQILARVVGAGPELDAYYAAFSLPDLLFTLVTGGALAFAFIPVLVELLAGDRDAAWRLFSAVINLGFVVVFSGAVLLGVFAEPIVALTVGRGFDPFYQQLTANLMRLILVATVLFSVSAVAMSTLQAQQHFLLPAVAPILYNLGILAGVIVLAPTMGVWGPAVGVVVGAALHLLIQVPGLIRWGARWSPYFGRRDANLRRVLILLAPRIVGLGLVQLTWVIAFSLASQLPEGSVTALRYGWLIMQLPETLIGTAIATAIFPTLSELASFSRPADLRAAVSAAVRAILALSVPATVGLIVLGRPFARVLFEGGQFQAQAVDMVTWAAYGFALGLIGHSLVEVFARTFYAQRDTLTPLFVAAGAMAVSVAASLLLSSRMGVAGLAVGNSIGVAVEAVALLLLLRRRLGGMDGRRIAVSTVRFAGAAAVMGAVLVALQALVAGGRPPSADVSESLLQMLIEVGVPLLVAGAVGAVVYVAAAAAFGAEEVRALPRVMASQRCA